MPVDLLPAGSEVYCVICKRWIPPHDPEGWTILVRESSLDVAHWECVEGHRENWGLTDGNLLGPPRLDAALSSVQDPPTADPLAYEIR